MDNTTCVTCKFFHPSKWYDGTGYCTFQLPPSLMCKVDAGTDYVRESDYCDFYRAIERAHKIGGNDE